MNTPHWGDIEAFVSLSLTKDNHRRHLHEFDDVNGLGKSFFSV